MEKLKKINLTQESTQFLMGLEKKGKSFNTVKNYRTDLNTFFKFLEQKKMSPEMNELTHQMLQEYDLFLEKNYNSPNSIRRRVQALRLFFDWLVIENKFSHNPIKKIVSSPKKVDIPRPLPFAHVLKLYQYLEQRVVESDELEKLISMRNLIVFHLIYGAGLKVSDIEALSQDHILPGKTIRVLISHPKRDPYTNPLPAGFIDLFTEYKNLLKEQMHKDNIEFDNILFNANPYKILKGGLSARGIEIILKEISKRLSITVTAKNLRQSCIFKWLNYNINDSIIKERMGVQPQYSLKPYHQLLSDEPEKYVYKEIEAKLAN
tara:strand:+ start:65683 stop:66642 length:960 start_codon:yes stop_codon:yes gene_type:complete